MQTHKQAAEVHAPQVERGRGVWVPADPDIGRAVRGAIAPSIGAGLVGGALGSVPGAAVGLLYGLLTSREPGQTRSRRALAMTAKGALGGFLGGAAIFGGTAGASEGRRSYTSRLISSRDRRYQLPSEDSDNLWRSMRQSMLGSGADDDTARSVLSTYIRGADTVTGRQSLFNRAIDDRNVMSAYRHNRNRHLTANPYRVAQEDFGPEVVFDADDANERLSPSLRPYFSINPNSPGQRAASIRKIDDGDPFIFLSSENVRTPIVYGHEYTHFRDPARGPIESEPGEILGTLVKDVLESDKRLGGRYEYEIPAMTTENVIAMQKERQTPYDLEARGDAARGAWIYDHMLRHGPQISDDPQLTPGDKKNIRSWIEGLRGDPAQRSRYENWLQVQTGKDG